MRTLDRYMLREMVVPFLIGHAAIVMMLTGSVLYNNAEIFLLHQAPLTDLFRIALFFLPFLVHMTMPVGMAVAAALTVSRMLRDSELTVCRAAGVSLRRIFLPIFVVGILVSVVDFEFGERVVPWSMRELDLVRSELPTHMKRLSPQKGQFLVSSDETAALYVQSILPAAGYLDLVGVTIFTCPQFGLNHETEPVWMTAKRGRYRDGVWTLDHPLIIHYRLDGRAYQTITPESATYTIPVNPQAFQSSFMMQMPMGSMANSARMTFRELGETVKRNREQHIHDSYAILDYHFKLSVPFSCLVMAICCPPLAFRFARGGSFVGVLLSICLVFVYWNTLLLSRILGSPGPDGSAALLTPTVAAWSQNVLYAILGLFVLWRSE